MKISAVSNVNAFKGAQEVSATTSPNEKKDIKEFIKDNKGKIALGLGALAAAGVAAVAISRGKKVSPELKINGFKEIPSELSIDDFKKIGKFDKGMATVNGKPFSGVINVTNKKDKYALEYADGTLKSSTHSKLTDIPAVISKKTYSVEDSAHVVEEEVFKRTLLKEPGIKRRIIDGDSIIKEAQDADGNITRDILVKQKDGKFEPKYRELEFKVDGKTHLSRIDCKSGDTLLDVEITT